MNHVFNQIQIPFFIKTCYLHEKCTNSCAYLYVSKYPVIAIIYKYSPNFLDYTKFIE
jgi:hypothetical protein